MNKKVLLALGLWALALVIVGVTAWAFIMPAISAVR